MFYGFYGFSQIRKKENGYESSSIIRVFETEEERGKELFKLRNQWNAELTPFIFTEEVCEKLNIKTIDDCIQVARKALMFNSRLPIRQDEAQAYFTNEELDKFRKRITCGTETKTQIYSTMPRYNFSPTWQEQIEKIQSEGLATQREKDIYFFGKLEEGNNEN